MRRIASLNLPVSVKNFMGGFRKSSSKPSLAGLSSMFDYLLPLILGSAVGWLCAVFVEYSLSSMNVNIQSSISANTATQQKGETNDGMTDFIIANPFAISPMPVINKEEEERARQAAESEKVITGSLASAVLIGTFPNVGIWINDKDKQNPHMFLSVGESFDVYMLDSVFYDRAIFTGQDKSKVTKFLYLLPDVAAASSPKPAAQLVASPVNSAMMGQIQKADPNGQEGVVPRELLNELLMNPFDEMKRFRLGPKFNGTESIGIEVQWIHEESLLGRLGVSKDDVIQSVNGIPIKNMGDVANAINSLMNGTRFDVDVLRGDTPTMLTYVVK